MIQTEESKLEFSSGLSSGAVLPFALRFFEKNDLQVYVTSGGVATLLSKDVDYTIADSSSYEHGADVTLQINPSSGAVVTVKRVLPVTQGLELPNHGKLPTESLEAQLDHATMVQQQHTEELARTFKVPLGDSRTASELIEQMISSGGGGGGGGSSYDFNSSEFNVTSGGSVSVRQIERSKITGLNTALSGKQDKLVSGGSYSINVDSAGHAGIANSLTSDAKSDILNSAGGKYEGPFALKTYGTGNDMTAGMNSGYVFAGGSRYLINSFDNDSIPFPEGATAFLTLSSGGGVISSGFTTSPSGVSSDTVVVRIGSRGLDTDKTEQFQFGDIVTVPWGIGGGGGGGTASVPMIVYGGGSSLSVGSNYTTSAGDAFEGRLPVGTGLGGVILGQVAVSGGKVEVFFPTGLGYSTSQTLVSAGASTGSAFVTIPVGPSTDFSFEVQGGGTLVSSTLMFYPYSFNN